MKTSEDLFDLVKSLTKSEKRYFKLNFPGSKSTNYLKLFDEIDSQSVYDEEVIKVKFKHEKFIKQLTFTKNYLYNSILNTLVSYNRSSSSETTLAEMVIKLRILFNKALYRQYFKTLKKYKQKAWEYEKFYIILELLRLQRLISEIRKFRTTNQELLYEEEKDVLNRITNLSEYSRIFYLAQALKRRAGIAGKAKSSKEADKLLKETLLSSTKFALSSQALEYFFHIKQILYSVMGDQLSQYNACQKRLACIESNPRPFMDDIVNVRKEALYTLTQLSIEMKRKNDFNFYMEKFFLASNKDAKVEGKIISNHINLKYILQTGIPANGDDICRKVEEDLIKFKGKLDKDMELESMFMTAKFYFQKNDFKTALIKNNDILSHPTVKFRKDIYVYSKLFNVPVHFELGNTGLVEYLLDSVRKLLMNEKDLYSLELESISVIQKLISLSVPADQKTLLDLERKLQELKSKSSSKEGYYYFDLISWIENKLKILKNSIGKGMRKAL